MGDRNELNQLSIYIFTNQSVISLALLILVGYLPYEISHFGLNFGQVSPKLNWVIPRHIQLSLVNSVYTYLLIKVPLVWP